MLSEAGMLQEEGTFVKKKKVNVCQVRFSLPEAYPAALLVSFQGMSMCRLNAEGDAGPPAEIFKHQTFFCVLGEFFVH